MKILLLFDFYVYNVYAVKLQKGGAPDVDIFRLGGGTQASAWEINPFACCMVNPKEKYIKMLADGSAYWMSSIDPIPKTVTGNWVSVTMENYATYKITCINPKGCYILDHIYGSYSSTITDTVYEYSLAYNEHIYPNIPALFWFGDSRTGWNQCNVAAVLVSESKAACEQISVIYDY